MIKTKLEYLEALYALEENGKLAKAIKEGKVSGSTEECWERQAELLDAMFEFEEASGMYLEE